MCESTVILRSHGGERVVMENVVHIEVSGEELNLTGILGERVSVKAGFVELDLEKHVIVVIPLMIIFSNFILYHSSTFKMVKSKIYFCVLYCSKKIFNEKRIPEKR